MTTYANVGHILLKRGNSAQISNYTGPLGELTYNTTTGEVAVHDNATVGGATILATQDYVTDAVANVVVGNIDLSGYATITYVTDSIANILPTNTLVNGNLTVELSTSGNLTMPPNSTIQTGSSNLQITAENYLMLNSGNGLGQIEIGRYQAGGAVVLGGPNTLTEVDGEFNVNGNVTYAGDIKQSYQDATSCPPGVDTVVYTATGPWQHALKLFVMVEGTPDGGAGSWETQACDIIAVRGYTDNTVHVTVYGRTYSSASAFADFDGHWNAITSRIEITCRPTSLTSSVVASVHAIEMTSND